MIAGFGWRASGLAAALMGVLCPVPAAAQRFAVDAELLGGSASLAWGEPGRRWGIAAGVTLPEIPETLTPQDEEFEEFLHVGLFLRRGAGPVEADVGLRASVAELYECMASDCWPGGFLGAYASGFVGWRHVKFGARIQAGRFFASRSDPDVFVVAVTPFVVRIAFGR